MNEKTENSNHLDYKKIKVIPNFYLAINFWPLKRQPRKIPLF